MNCVDGGGLPGHQQLLFGSAFWRLGMCPDKEKQMSFDLKKLVEELESVLAQRGSSLDAPAREAVQARIDNLKRAVEEASAADDARLRVEALNALATLLSVVTNVMTLLR